MSTLFGDPGGEHYFGLNGSNLPAAITAGWWNEVNGITLTSAAAAGRQAASDGLSYALAASGGGQFAGKYLPASFGHLIAGEAVYTTSSTWVANRIILAFCNGTSVSTPTTQCDVRSDVNGHLFVTNNGTQRGSTSTQVLTPGWHYIELDVTFATGATGTADVWVDGVRWVHATSVITATTVATANRVYYGGVIVNQQTYLKDMYLLDGATSPNNTPLGDVTVWAFYPNGAGVNAQFADGVASFTLTSVNTTGVYQGTITGGASNAYVGKIFSVTGFVNGANNQSNKVCTASNATSITLGGSTVNETHAGTAAFQPSGGAGMVNDGITHAGIWPDGDTTYILDSTAGHISDFAHEALSLTGTVFSVIHVSYVRKDDAGSRAFRQVCLSGGTTETNGADISATNTYLYYLDCLDVDPNTSSAWTQSGYNAATFGMKEIT